MPIVLNDVTLSQWTFPWRTWSWRITFPCQHLRRIRNCVQSMIWLPTLFMMVNLVKGTTGYLYRGSQKNYGNSIFHQYAQNWNFEFFFSFNVTDIAIDTFGIQYFQVWDAGFACFRNTSSNGCTLGDLYADLWTASVI